MSASAIPPSVLGQDASKAVVLDAKAVSNTFKRPSRRPRNPLLVKDMPVQVQKPSDAAPSGIPAVDAKLAKIAKVTTECQIRRALSEHSPMALRAKLIKYEQHLENFQTFQNSLNKTITIINQCIDVDGKNEKGESNYIFGKALKDVDFNALEASLKIMVANWQQLLIDANFYKENLPQVHLEIRSTVNGFISANTQTPKTADDPQFKDRAVEYGTTPEKEFKKYTTSCTIIRDMQLTGDKIKGTWDTVSTAWELNKDLIRKLGYLHIYKVQPSDIPGFRYWKGHDLIVKTFHFETIEGLNWPILSRCVRWPDSGEPVAGASAPAQPASSSS